MHKNKHIAIIGAGPTGLRAAEVASQNGAQVTVFDAKPSAGRKFLVAGKSGLNLTNGEDWDTFLTRYQGNNLPTDHWNEILTAFDHKALREWAGDLGIGTYIATSNKVFPTNMKAAPLLRRWIERLRTINIEFRFRHQFCDINQNREVTFNYQDQQIVEQFDAVVFALGGGSWANTGSTGKWVEAFTKHGIEVTPLTSANCGWEVDWATQVLEKAEGLPLKNIQVTAGETQHHGELIITKYGLEGGPIYRLGSAIKSLPEPEITIDFKPTFTIEQLIAKMSKAKPKANILKEAKYYWKLSPAVIAILTHRAKWNSVHQLAKEVKQCRIPLTRARPIEEAISSAGGVKWSELDENLMIKRLPGVYCAGEMLDWEAPTGGYLIQACFATGSWVGNALN